MNRWSSAGRFLRSSLAPRRLGLWLLVCGAGACAARTPHAGAPQVIAGSVCSGKLGLGPSSVGEAAAEAQPAAHAVGLAALMSEPAQPGALAELSVVELTTHRLRWRTQLAASARPQILSDLVVTTTGDRRLVGFDLASGRERFRVELPHPLWLGAAQSGKTILLTVSEKTWDPRQRGSSLIALDADSGSRRWQRDVPYALSRPVIRGGRALVVAERADLWSLELESGADRGCGPLGGNSVDWFDAEPSGLFFGSSEARVLGPDARERPAAWMLPRLDLPGRPFLRASSYQPWPAGRSAHGRVAVVAPLRTDGAGPVLDGRYFYDVFYSDLFGFRADGTLAWAQLTEADVVRAEPGADGLWSANEAGVIELRDAESGAVRASLALGRRVTSADLVPPAGAAAPPPTASPEPSATPQSSIAQPLAASALQVGLKRVAEDSDARLLPARAFAVDELAKLDTPGATEDLLAIYRLPNAPSLLRERIAKRLSEQRHGAEHLLAALAQHADFLEQRPAPPLPAIVPGLITQHETRAIPELVAHLFDPETPSSDLALLVSALDALSGDEGREPLARFFAMYRADSALASDPRALELAAAALLERPDRGSRALLEETRDSPLTPPALREPLARLLSPPPTAAEPEPAQVAAEAAEAPQPAPELRAVLDAARPQFEPCVSATRARSPRLSAIRLWFVEQPDGSVRDVHVVPVDRALAACLGQKLGELELPNERKQKQLVSYRLVLPPSAASDDLASLADAPDDQFWSQAERAAADRARKSNAAPWWLDKNPLFVAIDSVAQNVAGPASAAKPPAPPRSAAPATRAPAQPSSSTSGAATPPAAPAAPPKAASTPAEDSWWVPAAPAPKP